MKLNLMLTCMRTVPGDICLDSCFVGKLPHSANTCITCLLWWTESLLDLGLDLCCAVLHEDGTVWITLGHLLLPLCTQHSIESEHLPQVTLTPFDQHNQVTQHQCLATLLC